MKKVKIIIGWCLIAFQIMAIIGRLINNTPFPTGIAGVFNILGFCSFGVLGGIFLYLGYRSKTDTKKEDKNNTDNKITEQASNDRKTDNKSIDYKTMFIIVTIIAVIALICLALVIIKENEPEKSNSEHYTTCTFCKGSGHRSCTACRGIGSINCPTCGGDCKEKCPSCSNCVFCGGSGINFNTLTTCEYCVRGGTKCSVCSNQKYIKCSQCTTGTIDCYKCTNGKQECQKCDGSGKIKENSTD